MTRFSQTINSNNSQRFTAFARITKNSQFSKVLNRIEADYSAQIFPRAAFIKASHFTARQRAVFASTRTDLISESEKCASASARRQKRWFAAVQASSSLRCSPDQREGCPIIRTSGWLIPFI